MQKKGLWEKPVDMKGTGQTIAEQRYRLATDEARISQPG